MKKGEYDFKWYYRYHFDSCVFAGSSSCCTGFSKINSGNYLEVEGIVTEWNYSDEEKSEIRVIGIMDNKTNKEIFVTVYSKGIHKGEYLKVKYLPHSKYGEIEENE